MLLLCLALLAEPVPSGAIVTTPTDAAMVARARPTSEPLRALVEYGSALAAMTLVNAGGVASLNGARVTVSQQGSVSLNGSGGSMAAAGACFLLSPLAAALSSWAVGKTSPQWDPSLGWAAVGAYGSSAIAIGAGMGLSAMGVGHDAAVFANTALYLGVPLGTVLVQNATKTPR
jgi:hypothetical protein